MRYRLLSFATVFVMMLGAAAFAQQPVVAEEHCVVNVATDDVLNVRRQPSSSSDIASRLRFNECDVIVVGDCQGNWCPVEARHDTGWVHKHYISMVSPYLYCVAGVAQDGHLDLRKWPSPGSKHLTRLRHDQCDIAFLPYATNNWQKIRVGGWEGWVERQFLSGQ